MPQSYIFCILLGEQGILLGDFLGMRNLMPLRGLQPATFWLEVLPFTTEQSELDKNDKIAFGKDALDFQRKTMRFWKNVKKQKNETLWKIATLRVHLM